MPIPPTSPLPWRTDRRDPERLLDSDGEHIATVRVLAYSDTGARPTVEGEANAAIIVRAVNAHAAFVDVARDAIEFAGRFLRTCKRNENEEMHAHASAVVTAASAALAAAEGKD